MKQIERLDINYKASTELKATSTVETPSIKVQEMVFPSTNVGKEQTIQRKCGDLYKPRNQLKSKIEYSLPLPLGWLLMRVKELEKSM